jgi:putative toxin-antitoxin system antitoxin component (TIGR02293 family)
MANTTGNLDTARVLRQAFEVWGSRAAANEWLHSPVRALGGKIPMELLGTPEGRCWVSEVLLKIENGDFS